jgi:hypothetical protein
MPFCRYAFLAWCPRSRILKRATDVPPHLSFDVDDKDSFSCRETKQGQVTSQFLLQRLLSSGRAERMDTALAVDHNYPVRNSTELLAVLTFSRRFSASTGECQNNTLTLTITFYFQILRCAPFIINFAPQSKSYKPYYWNSIINNLSNNWCTRR